MTNGGWKAKISLEEGDKEKHHWFLKLQKEKKSNN